MADAASGPGVGRSRAIMPETVAWRQVRDAGLAGLDQGLKTGDFSEAPRDPLAAQAPGYPPTAGIQAAYQAIMDADDFATMSDYATGLELQDALLESARRTSAVLKSTRGASLARMQKMLDDAVDPKLPSKGRKNLLDDLLLTDDLPVGPAPEPPTAST